MAQRPEHPSTILGTTRFGGGGDERTFHKTESQISWESIRYVGDCIRYLADVIASARTAGVPAATEQVSADPAPSAPPTASAEGSTGRWLRDPVSGAPYEFVPGDQP